MQLEAYTRARTLGRLRRCPSSLLRAFERMRVTDSLLIFWMYYHFCGHNICIFLRCHNNQVCWLYLASCFLLFYFPSLPFPASLYLFFTLNLIFLSQKFSMSGGAQKSPLELGDTIYEKTLVWAVGGTIALHFYMNPTCLFFFSFLDFSYTTTR